MNETETTFKEYIVLGTICIIVSVLLLKFFPVNNDIWHKYRIVFLFFIGLSLIIMGFLTKKTIIKKTNILLQPTQNITIQEKPNFIDGLVVFIFALSIVFLAVIYHNPMGISISIILYGIYGLFSKRIMIFGKGRSKGGFFVGSDAIKISNYMILLGTIITIVFYFI